MQQRIFIVKPSADLLTWSWRQNVQIIRSPEHHVRYSPWSQTLLSFRLLNLKSFFFFLNLKLLWHCPTNPRWFYSNPVTIWPKQAGSLSGHHSQTFAFFPQKILINLNPSQTMTSIIPDYWKEEMIKQSDLNPSHPLTHRYAARCPICNPKLLVLLTEGWICNESTRTKIGHDQTITLLFLPHL